MEPTRLRLGELLVDAKIITREQLEEVLAAQKEDGRRLGTLLVERGYINETQLTQILSQQFSVPWVSLYHVDFSKRLLSMVPRHVADKFCLVPIYVRHVRGQGDTLYVAMDDPTNLDALRACASWAGLPTRAMIASPSDIRRAIDVYYGVAEPGESEDERGPATTAVAVPHAGKGAKPPEVPSPSEEIVEEEIAEEQPSVELPKTEPDPGVAKQREESAEAEAGEPTSGAETAEPTTEAEASEPTTEAEAGEPTSGAETAEPTSGAETAEPTTEAEASEPTTEVEAGEPTTEAETETETEAEAESTEPPTEGGEVAAEPASSPADTGAVAQEPPVADVPTEPSSAEAEAEPISKSERRIEVVGPFDLSDEEANGIAAAAFVSLDAGTLGPEEEAAGALAAATSGASAPATTDVKAPEGEGNDDVRVEVGEEVPIEDLFERRKRHLAEEEEADAHAKPQKVFSLTLLDGTTLALPVRRRRKKPVKSAVELMQGAPSDATEGQGEEGPPPSGPPPPSRPPPAEDTPDRDDEDRLTARDVLAALRAAAHGVDASEVLDDAARWETMVAVILSLLLRKGIIKDDEFVDELDRI